MNFSATARVYASLTVKKEIHLPESCTIHSNFRYDLPALFLNTISSIAAEKEIVKRKHRFLARIDAL
jgi:hypothetical protein